MEIQEFDVGIVEIYANVYGMKISALPIKFPNILLRVAQQRAKILQKFTTEEALSTALSCQDQY